MKKAQKTTVQFYMRHKAKLNVYIGWCVQIYLNLSHWAENTILNMSMQALNFANIFIA
jgi:hypothetical protein